MDLGAMNSPNKDIAKEIRLFGEMGFDFIDLTVEAPRANPDALIAKEKEIKGILSSYEMFVVCHAPWFFDIGHPYGSIQRAFLNEAKRVIEIATRFEAGKVGLHIMKPKGLFEDKLGHNIRGIKEVVKEAEDQGITVCIENLDLPTFSVSDFRRIFGEVPGAKFLLDIGHANLGIREEDEILLFLRNFKDMLVHVHAHDNLGGIGITGDLHLPIGAGNIDWKKVVKELKRVYDGTITLEIHSQDIDYLRISREKFLKLWK